MRFDANSKRSIVAVSVYSVVRLRRCLQLDERLTENVSTRIANFFGTGKQAVLHARTYGDKNKNLVDDLWNFRHIQRKWRH